MSGEIFIMGGGGGGRPYAFIIVNYPEGSTVTCNNINGKKELSSTKILFYVKKPSSGSTVNCSVSCSNTSGQSASQTVSITSEGQSKTVTLSYAFVLWTAGNGLTAFNNLFEKTSSYGSVRASGSNIVVCGTWDQGQTGVISKTNSIVLTAGMYSKLAITGKVLNGYGSLTINVKATKSGSNVATYSIPNSGYVDTDFVVRNLTIPASMTNCYIEIVSQNGHEIEISDIRFIK